MAQQEVTTPEGKTYFVSTVFLANDYNFAGLGPPVLFETMVFARGEDRDEFDEYCDRYHTRAEAEAGHRHVVAMIVAGRLSDLLEE